MGTTAARDGCVFCEVIAHRSPSFVVYEDAETLAFLDLFPVTRGHVLVVPKPHIDRLTDLPEESYRGYLRAVTEVCRRMERLSSHYNVSMNQGELAGQIIFHMHFHVIPRYGEGTPNWARPRTRLEEGDARALVAALSAG
jgi:histidine triad (HIT) family protein